MACWCCDPSPYGLIFWVRCHMWLRRGTWLQLGEIGDRGNVELKVVLVDIFQPALISGLQSTCGTALHMLCHKGRSSEVSPNVCQRPLLVDWAARGLCRGCLGWSGRCSLHCSWPWAHLLCHSLGDVHGEMFALATKAPKPIHRYTNTEVSPWEERCCSLVRKTTRRRLISGFWFCFIC